MVFWPFGHLSWPPPPGHLFHEQTLLFLWGTPFSHTQSTRRPQGRPCPTSEGLGGPLQGEWVVFKIIILGICVRPYGFKELPHTTLLPGALGRSGFLNSCKTLSLGSLVRIPKLPVALTEPQRGKLGTFTVSILVTSVFTAELISCKAILP